MPWLPDMVQHLRLGLQNEFVWRAVNASANALTFSEPIDTIHDWVKKECVLIDFPYSVMAHVVAVVVDGAHSAGVSLVRAHSGE